MRVYKYKIYKGTTITNSFALGYVKIIEYKYR